MTGEKYCAVCGSEKSIWRMGAMSWYGSCDSCGFEKGEMAEDVAKEYVDGINKLREVISTGSMKTLMKKGITVDKLKRMVAILEEDVEIVDKEE